MVHTAGFLQNSSSFCAIPTTLLSFESFESVLSLARARLQMTALFGSAARCPQASSTLKPLPQLAHKILPVTFTYMQGAYN